MHFITLLAAAGTVALSLAAPQKRASSRLRFVGINESGPEFGDGKYPGTLGKDYTWPTLSTYDTYIAKGFNVFRINFSMERLIPNSLTGSLDSTYMASLNEQVNYITSRGAYAMVQPHNYGRYYGNIITDASAFKAWWQTVAAQFKSNNNVIFDTNNEYNTMAGALVATMNQAAIDGIRAAGATTQIINVEGNSWTGAWTWTTSKGTDGLTNADTMGSLTDPSNNLVYQMHQYLDSDGSGTSTACVSATVGSERLVAATNWLRANGKIGLIGEFAGGNNAQCQSAVKDMLAYMQANTDVWQGAIWWAAGPWWADYIYSIEPSTGVAYAPYVPILQSALSGSAAPTSTTTSSPPKTTTTTVAPTTTTTTTTSTVKTTSGPSTLLDAQDFLAGQFFDIRVEVHAPVNGSEATNGVPDTNFALTVGKVGEAGVPAAQFFGVDEPALEAWNFTWFEDLFAQDAKTPSLVNVAAKAYRRVALYEPGSYEAVLTYNGTNTTAVWDVRDLSEVRKTKNVLLFIGDGMTTNMITAARLIAHKQKNGRYLTKMALDQFPALGHQMTHSIDSFITDSANSASALYTGHKSSVNALGVYADSSKDPYDDPKVESIMEIFYRLYGGKLGIVSTAFLADATPAAFTAKTRSRDEYGAVIDSFIHGIVNYTWTDWPGYDVVLGGGAENFYSPSLGGVTYNNLDYYKVFADAGYDLIYNNTALQAASSAVKTLGVFSVSNMAKWVDRNVFPDNLKAQKNDPTGTKGDALDQPGLKQMTLKAIDILETRSKADGDKGWFLMSEAASIDKMMHVLDYDRALGELLELDDTVKASIEYLTKIGELDNTLIIVTADHGHGFDVFGNADTQYLNAQTTDRNKRKAVGTYQNSGESQYINTGNLKYTDSFFPSNWDPRYTLAQGFGANPDHRENYQIHKGGPRLPATNITGFAATNYFVNPKDNVNGFIVNGTLPPNAAQGVHSLTDVPVFARGPCHELFTGVYNSIDIFYHIAECLGASRSEQAEEGGHGDQGNGTNWQHHGKGGKGYHHYGPGNPTYKKGPGKGPWGN
ncbi:hypothetical protein B0A48_14142 [Cryoendolithus antarcticus]|uniref:Glycoside hydrolase family 5 domain-containing protein n=1 Tax=Cryoendolithus antarcticus TaxID=1507870 RepID=A0A1V8SLN3_9PEZI|nr:hypothetical protein B0A48_14142 [Cryoendolithus antarcticus]